MKHLGMASFIAGVAIVVFGCSSSAPGDSETHWVVCKTTSDCRGGQSCENEHCVARTSVGARSSIGNPTGTCVAPDSGARRGYHSPEAGDVWLPDCKNPLKREYYRVFAQSETSAYVIPRPDGAVQVVQACISATHPMYALVEKYSLCEPASDQATVERINHMTPADALTLTHYIHGQLIFESSEGIPGVYVRPYPMPSDVVDACALHPAEMSPELATDCESERAAIDSGLEEPVFGSSGEELATLLNELYGVAGCVRPELAARVCMSCAPDACFESEIRCTKRCTTPADCAGVSAGPNCSGICQRASGC